MANTYLTRTQSSTGSETKGTFSAWVKRSGLTTASNMYTSYQADNEFCDIQFNDSDQLQVVVKISGTDYLDLRTTRLFRDTSAFYHIVVVFDSTDNTQADRCKLYVNGTRETSFATNTNNVSSSLNMRINGSSQNPYIGSWHNQGNYFSGVMSHIHWVDGTAYQASTFGSTDSTTGEWKINTAPSVTYGTNGFFILKDGNSVTDQSTNSNNFSLGGGTLTKTEDCPDNNFATGNPLYLTDSAWTTSLSNGNNTFTGHTGTNSYPTLASTIAMPSSGKYYAEFKLTSSSAYIYCGIATPECVSGTAVDGHYPNYANEGGSNANAYSLWGNNGQKYVKENGGTSTVSNYGSGLSQNDIIQVACDLDNNKLYIGVNGTYFNSGVPTSGSTGTGAITILNNEYLMFMCDGGQSTDASGQANFGNGFFGTTAVTTNSGNGYAGAEGKSIFNYQPPTGYSALTTRGLNE